jgi:hypothetical protein
MKNYHIVASTETDKYSIIDTIRAAGAVLTGVSGYGSGYYIQMDATEAQADYINRHLYTSDIHNMDAAGILAAWKNQEVTMHQVLTWQQRHGVILEASV